MTERSCGNCSACCTRMAVEGLKPAQVRCEFQKREGGCSRYSTRPAGCQSYSCAWLQGMPAMGRNDRPDRLGVIFDMATSPALRTALESTGLPWIVAREIAPGAFNSTRVLELLEFFSGQGVVLLDYAGGIKGRPALVAPKGAEAALAAVVKGMEEA